MKIIEVLVTTEWSDSQAAPGRSLLYFCSTFHPEFTKLPSVSSTVGAHDMNIFNYKGKREESKAVVHCIIYVIESVQDSQ